MYSVYRIMGDGTHRFVCTVPCMYQAIRACDVMRDPGYVIHQDTRDVLYTTEWETRG